MTTALASDRLRVAPEMPAAPSISPNEVVDAAPAVIDVVHAILADSRQAPQVFLDEVVVPHGGE